MVCDPRVNVFINKHIDTWIADHGSFVCVTLLYHMSDMAQCHTSTHSPNTTTQLSDNTVLHCNAVYCSEMQCIAVCSWYGVAMVSRIDKIIGLFCRISSLLYVSFAEYRLLYKALLQKRLTIVSILLIKATPYSNRGE